MATFLALYHGNTVNTSEILALTADHRIVEDFAVRLLGEPSDASADPVVSNIEKGRRRALEVVRDERA
ncbi:MAG: hypothetical protein H0U55_09290 [Rubrobacteraceae bacterium]|nr:hypothetical protein [Rubrobacteraceae bacterium]